MNDCRNIEPLLYLYRDGELSQEERARVSEHAKVCAECRAVLGNLYVIDEAIAPLREEVPVLSGKEALINDTIYRIAGNNNTGRSRRRSSILDDILRWFQPAFGFAFVAAVLLFFFQQTRDAVTVTNLENRLRADGSSVIAEHSAANSIVNNFVDVLLKEQHRGTPISSSVKSAGLFSDPTQLISSGILSLLRNNSGIFDEFSSRYPNLANIRIDDGINEHERKILETEGRAFLKEFEQLLQEGKK